MLDGLLLEPSRRASLKAAAERYELHLEQALTYLDGRGVTEEAARSFHLGFVSDPAPGHERFAGWLAFPYMTRSGPVAMKFRCMEDHDHKALNHGKYDGPGGQKIRLYNAGVLAFGGDVVLVCEGEMDTVLASSTFDVPAVGTWGTNWLDHHPRCFSDFDRVVVVADHDVKEDDSSPGIKHAKKVAATISRAEVVTPPPGLDISEWIERDGADAVREGLGL